MLKVDPKGSFYGSETYGTGGNDLLASGAYKNEAYVSGQCMPTNTLLAGAACNSTTYTANNQAAQSVHDTGYLNRESFVGAATDYLAGTETDMDAFIAGAAGAIDGPASTSLYSIPVNTTTGASMLTTFVVNRYIAASIDPTSASAAADFALLSSGDQTTATTTAYGQILAAGGNFQTMTVTGGLSTAGKLNTAANAAAVWGTAGNIDAWDYTQAATVHMKANANKFVEAKDDGQWGIKLSKYFDDVGTGLDMSFYAANYHSKIPYFRAVGKGGVLAGDIVGAYTSQVTAAQSYVGVSLSSQPAGAYMLTAGTGVDIGTALGVPALVGSNGLGYTANSNQHKMMQAFAPLIKACIILC
jgi:hypothetical protein